MKSWFLRAVLVACCAFFGMAQVVWAAPAITEPFLFVEYFSPNPLGIPEGPLLALGCSVSDSLGIPGNIKSATAVALKPGEPDYTLEFLNLDIISGLYQLPLIGQPAYSGQTGQWRIDVVNQQDETVSVVTHDLDKIRLIPFAQNISFSNNSTTPLITWDPVLYDHDGSASTPDAPVNNYRIRLIYDGGYQFYRSDTFTSPSFQVPAGVLAAGDRVYVRIEARQIDPADNAVENRSDTFTTSLFIPSGSAKVPVMNGWWLLPAALAGLGVMRRCRKA